MIAFIENAPGIELSGEHFRLTLRSGSDEAQFILTAKAFYGLRLECEGAFAQRRVAEMESRDRVISFSRSRAKKGKPTSC